MLKVNQYHRLVAIFSGEEHEEVNNAPQKPSHEPRNCVMLPFLAEMIHLVKVKINSLTKARVRPHSHW